MMHVCQSLQLEPWIPNFSNSGQSSPRWTKAKCGRHVIVNSLEWADWEMNPVQVVLCDACGHHGCASGGFVHVSRLAQCVLFTPEQPDPEYSGAGLDPPPYFIQTLGAIAIPEKVWAESSM